MTPAASYTSYAQADASAGDGEDHDPGFLNADQCGWVAATAFCVMVLLFIYILAIRPFERKPLRCWLGWHRWRWMEAYWPDHTRVFQQCDHCPQQRHSETHYFDHEKR